MFTTAATVRQREHRAGSFVRGGPVIVAAGGGDVTPALRAGDIVGRFLARDVVVASVIARVPLDVWDQENYPNPGTFAEERAAATRAYLEQALQALPTASAWPVEILAGEVPRSLAYLVQVRESPLLIMGLHRHGRIDRLLGTDNASRTLELAECPVLAIAPSFDAVPDSAAVGMDFSRSSVFAAQTAAQLLRPGGTLHLVHVWEPADTDDTSRAVADELYCRHLSDRFRRVILSLALPSSIVVKQEVREGPPSERLMDFAEAHRVDLVAVGRSRRGFVQRVVVGGVADRVLRRAGCSVLIVPEGALGELPESEPAGDRGAEFIPRAAWSGALDAFARRNAGRVVSLEVRDPAHGVISSERGYIFFGTSCAEAQGAIRIVLGETHGRRQHVMRTVSDAMALVVIRCAEGGDAALRIEHGGGQTLLTLSPNASAAPLG